MWCFFVCTITQHAFTPIWSTLGQSFDIPHARRSFAVLLTRSAVCLMTTTPKWLPGKPEDCYLKKGAWFGAKSTRRWQTNRESLPITARQVNKSVFNLLVRPYSLMTRSVAHVIWAEHSVCSAASLFVTSLLLKYHCHTIPNVIGRQ